MRSPKLIGLIAAASVLAACSGQNSSVMSHPGSAGMTHSIVHALVAPGKAGQMAIMPGAPRALGHREPAFTATSPCTYLTDNFSGNVNVYNRNLTLAGTIATATHGWGAYAVHTSTLSAVFLGRNDGTGDVDMYTPCTDTLTGTLTGLGTGGNAYGIFGFRGAGKPGYATDWSVGDIEYWATGTGTPVSKVDPNMPLPYFGDVDKHGHVFLDGYDASFGSEIVDLCTKIITKCKTVVSISGGFPGDVQVDSNEQLYVNNQFGQLTSYDCSSLTACNLTGTFTYSNGSNPLDYTGTALDPLLKHKLWGANIFFCPDGCSFGLASDAQPQTLPLNSATLGKPTPEWDNTETLGVARYKPDTP